MLRSAIAPATENPRRAISPRDIPELGLDSRAGFILACIDGASTVDYGGVATGTPSVKTFTIRNAGSGGAQLTGLAVSKDGPDAADFTVGSLTTTTLGRLRSANASTNASGWTRERRGGVAGSSVRAKSP